MILTPAQRTIVIGLIAGKTMKEIAFEMESNQPAIAGQVIRARQANGGITLYQLVARFAVAEYVTNYTSNKRDIPCGK